MAMAAASPFLLLQPLAPKRYLPFGPLHPSLFRTRHLRCSPNGAAAPEPPPKPTPRRGRKKASEPGSSPTKAKGTRRKTKKEGQESDSEGEEEPAKPKTRRTRKPKQEAKQQEEEARAEEPKKEAREEDSGSDSDDFPYEWPPLVCCLGAPRWEFVPTVRVSDHQMHPDQYSTWLHLQWEPPEFARSPGSAASNVAIALTRLGGRAAVLGKVGDDDFGHELVYRMNRERVQTRAIRFDCGASTAIARMKVGFRDREDGEGGTSLVAETVKSSAEDSLHEDEIDADVLKEVSPCSCGKSLI
jgi:hypothetical protein